MSCHPVKVLELLLRFVKIFAESGALHPGHRHLHIFEVSKRRFSIGNAVDVVRELGLVDQFTPGRVGFRLEWLSRHSALKTTVDVRLSLRALDLHGESLTNALMLHLTLHLVTLLLVEAFNHVLLEVNDTVQLVNLLISI